MAFREMIDRIAPRFVVRAGGLQPRQHHRPKHLLITAGGRLEPEHPGSSAVNRLPELALN